MAIPPGSVWLDARGAQSVGHAERGIARYVAAQAKALVEIAPEAVGAIGLKPDVPVPPTIDPLIRTGLVKFHSQTGAGMEVPPIYHVMSPFEMEFEREHIWPAWIRAGDSRLVVTLYDLIPLIMRDQYLADWGYWATAWVARLGLMRSAHQVLTISRQTADDAVEHLGVSEDRITVIDSGVSAHHASLVGSRADAETQVSARFPKIRPGFLLYVGGADFRKNLDGMIRAYAQLPEDVRRKHQLVIACNLAYMRKRQLLGLARNLGIASGGVVLTGFVSDRELAALYRTCKLFVFPSLYEGAGLPILEAMSCGAPVATSGVSAMPELLGDMEATFNPADPADIARCLREILGDPAQMERLRERSARQIQIYTWKRVAERTLDGYEAAMQQPLELAHRPRRADGRRKRIAVVTAWPTADGTGSKAELHSRRLVEFLAEHADVDVIVPAAGAANGAAGLDRSLEPKVRIRSDSEMAWMDDLLGYEQRLYVIDSSAAHLHALEAMHRAPGVALVHDIRLFGLYEERHRESFPGDPRWLEDKLIEMYGERMPRSLLVRIPRDTPEVKERINMTREVQSLADRVLVHSRHQSEMLALERPGDGAPAEVVPFGIPAMPAEPEGEAPANGRGPTVVAFPGEAPWPELIAAFAELSEARPGVRLKILGEPGEAGRAGIADAGGRLGVGESVEITGSVGQAERWEALRYAAAAIELRPAGEAGRASSAVCDCIAARVPVIASEVGWPADLPEGVAILVAAEATPIELARDLERAIADEDDRALIREAQDDYAEQASYAKLAERYAEVLGL